MVQDPPLRPQAWPHRPHKHPTGLSHTDDRLLGTGSLKMPKNLRQQERLQHRQQETAKHILNRRQQVPFFNINLDIKDLHSYNTRCIIKTDSS